MNRYEKISSKWIDENSYNVHLLGTPDVETVAVPREKLQNLLVPKREEVDRAYKDGYEKGKEHAGKKQKEEPETVASVFADLILASARFKEVLGLEVEELEEEEWK